MTFSIGIILILAILCWIVSLRYEWNMPFNWQAYIRTWKEELSNNSHRVYFVWDSDPENGEMEKRFWHLQRIMPGLQMKYKIPLWIEVRIYRDVCPEAEEKYISCLQRRFSQIKISDGPFNNIGSDKIRLSGSEQEERDFCALFSDVKSRS